MHANRTLNGANTYPLLPHVSRKQVHLAKDGREECTMDGRKEYAKDGGEECTKDGRKECAKDGREECAHACK